MPFGRHRGERITEVPPSYLIWILCNLTELSPTLKLALIESLFLDRGER